MDQDTRFLFLLRRFIGLAIASLVILTFQFTAPAIAAAVVLKPGDIIVAEDTTTSSQLVRVDPDTGEQTLVFSGTSLRDVCPEADGSLLVLYWSFPDMIVGRLDPLVGSIAPISTGGYFADPQGMAVVRDQVAFVADQFATVGVGGGGVIQVDLLTGEQTVVLGIHVHPRDVAVEASDSLIVMTRVGGLIKVDPKTGAESGGVRGYRWLSSSPPSFIASIALEADGWVVGTAPGPPGQVLRADPITGAWSVVSSGGFLVSPFGITVAENGDILIADRDALPGGSGAKGAVIRIDPVTGGQTIVSSGGFFHAPHAIAVAGVRNGVVPLLSVTWGSIKARYR